VRTLTILALVAACLAGCGDGEPIRPMIAAATSLRAVMPALLEAYGEQEFLVTYAGSGTLRRQIEAGAGIDLAVFAGGTHVDSLVASGLAVADSRTVVASNQLVLIGPRDAGALTFETLASLPADERLAIGDPRSVPAGRYAQEALEGLGSWPALKSRFVYAQDVGGVLTYVRHGEVAAGIVYVTEIRDVDSVKLLDRADGAWAPHPTVVAVTVKDGDNPEAARAFLTFLGSARARQVFKRFGFGSP